MSSDKHHYVTAAYLEGMLLRGDPRLWVYERNKSRVFRNIPKNLAFKRGYHTIARSDGSEGDKFEALLATEIEGNGIPVLRKLATGSRQLRWEEIAFGASLIAMQELRVPFMREQLGTMMSGIQQQIMNFAISIPGYLEHSLQRLSTEGKVTGEVTADGLRESVMSGKVILQANPEASLKALVYMLPTLVEPA